MKRKQPDTKAGKAKPGPEPLRFNIEGDVGEAVSRIVGAGKPQSAKKIRAARSRRNKGK